MKLTIYYENLKQELEVDTDEMWSCLGFEDINVSNEEKEKLIQDKVDKEWNLDEYNNWRNYNKHLGIAKKKEKLIENDEGIDVMDLFPDMRLLNSYEKEQEYVKTCKKIRKILKGYNDWADIVIAIALNGYSVTEYAIKVGSSRKAISKKYNKALKLLKTFYKKGFRNGTSRGYRVGGVKNE